MLVDFTLERWIQKTFSLILHYEQNTKLKVQQHTQSNKMSETEKKTDLVNVKSVSQ